jgi:hypothetical protein
MHKTPHYIKAERGMAYISAFIKHIIVWMTDYKMISLLTNVAIQLMNVAFLSTSVNGTDANR